MAARTRLTVRAAQGRDSGSVPRARRTSEPGIAQCLRPAIGILHGIELDQPARVRHVVGGKRPDLGADAAQFGLSDAYRPVASLRSDFGRRYSAERAWAVSPSPRASTESGAQRGSRAPRLARAIDQAGALLEIVDPQRRGEARRARGRQHVVGAGAVVAQRLGGVASHEDRAGVADLGGQRLRVLHRQLQMLRRDLVGDRRSPRRDRAPGSARRALPATPR